MTAALTDLRTVLASATIVAVVLVAAVAISPFGIVHGSGDSMRPALCDGSVSIVDERLEPDVGDVVLVDVDGDRTRMHEAVLVTDEHVVTRGSNDDDLDLLLADRDETADRVVDGIRMRYPERDDVVGVVVAVVDDGCTR
jgi:hypothetical protein